ncbi:MAG: C25 family cysteine peptidase [Thermoplasmatota archaeon]
MIKTNGYFFDGRINSKKCNCVIISDSNPYFGLLGAVFACQYPKEENDSLLPLMVTRNNQLTEKQIVFLKNYTNLPVPLFLGNTSEHDFFDGTSIVGSAPNVSLQLARMMFKTADAALILPYNSDIEYQLSVIASPLASYLNMPLFLVDNNSNDINNLLISLDVSTLYVVGESAHTWTVEKKVFLRSIEKIHSILLDVIKQRFKAIRYMTLTNPSDVVPLDCFNQQKRYINEYITCLSVTLFGKTMILQGKNTIINQITVPSGINNLKIQVNITDEKSIFNTMQSVDPILSIKLLDTSNETAAYASSQACGKGLVSTETLICEQPGKYSLVTKMYHGFKGGFFSLRGFSQVNAKLNITITLNQLNKSHYPLISNLSMLAPYLTCAHGGIIIANESFGLTSEEYETAAHESATGPWYSEKIHSFNNQKVNHTLEHIESVFSLMQQKKMFSSFLDGPAWLAILADTNMIPMYYYSPSQPGLLEKGLASDNPYSCNHSLSTGRILGSSVSDVSLLLCRTFFYEQLCGPANENDSWYTSFHFMFGEGFGETGGLFHQMPYAQEITQYGFQPSIYGNFRNSRQAATKLGIFSDANYVEYLGHGDWFWFTPSLYGLDMYSKAIDVAHVKDWVFSRPNLFLTSACLMGRVDGIPPSMNIGLNFLSAGSNAFVGATRETGQEAGLEIMENALIIDDLSMGEALRREKRRDKEMPTYVLRTLYGDPAFNPYEPNNGFSDQGRPKVS